MKAAPSATPPKLPPRKAKQLLDHGARAFCELLDDVDKFDPELFLRKARNQRLISRNYL